MLASFAALRGAAAARLTRLPAASGPTVRSFASSSSDEEASATGPFTATLFPGDGEKKRKREEGERA